MKTVFSLIVAAAIGSAMCAMAQQAGDIVTADQKSYRIIGSNLITNPGFESGLTGWTAGNSAALGSSNFQFNATGGVDNSAYICGTVNGGNTEASSIATAWAVTGGKSYYFSFYVKWMDSSKAAQTQQYLKVSLTSATGTGAAESAVLIDAASVAAGGAWTQNKTAFANSVPYGYLQVRFRWLNNQFGFDNFALFEVEEVADPAVLTALIDEANAIYTAAAEGAADLLTAIEAAQALLGSNSAAVLEQAAANLRSAINSYRLLNASPELPYDASGFIVNPSFEPDFNGWSNSGFAAQTNADFSLKNGSTYIEKWVAAGSNVPNVSVQQTLSALPIGRYTLTAAAHSIKQSPTTAAAGAYLFAGTAKTAVGTVNNYSVDFLALDGTAVIGFAAQSATANWVACDNFRLAYKGVDAATIKAFIEQQTADANALLEKKMQASERSSLAALVAAATALVADTGASLTQLSDMSLELRSAIDSARLSVNAFAALQAAIDSAQTAYGEGTGTGAAELLQQINAAQTVNDNLNAALEDIYAAAAAVRNAALVYLYANPAGTAPTVKTFPEHSRGATLAFGKGSVSSISTVKELGICWSTAHNPTIFDSRNTASKSATFICRMNDLLPQTVYYVRAYAITNGYAVAYGEEIKMVTLPKGVNTYSMNSIPAEHYERINNAMSTAVNYWNNVTSIRSGKEVNYGSGTPTAEASYGGWMRFGPLASYQQTGTALHEMAHTVGIGTHGLWTNANLHNTSTQLWLGERTTAVLNFMRTLTGETGTQIKGDTQHFWPYGINGAQEDTGSDLLYIINSMLVQAMGEDGLPATSAINFATPSYSLDIAEGDKYYIRNENPLSGRDSLYLVEAADGKIAVKQLTYFQATGNDSAAWHLIFNPATRYYAIQNAASGKFFYYKASGSNGIGLQAVSAVPVQAEGSRFSDGSGLTASQLWFQLLASRIATPVGNNGKTYSAKAFWIIRPGTVTETPPVFSLTAAGAPQVVSFDMANTAVAQRWILLSSAELLKFEQAVNNVTDISEIAEQAFGMSGNIRISVYDLLGRLRLQTGEMNEINARNLSTGIFIVSITDGAKRVVKKIAIK
jgi:hypothetical protein